MTYKWTPEIEDEIIRLMESGVEITEIWKMPGFPSKTAMQHHVYGFGKPFGSRFVAAKKVGGLKRIL